MTYSVQFRFNKLTGEVEEFVVDQDTGLAGPEHNALHDETTRELANLLARFPETEELSPAYARRAVRGPQPDGSESDVDAEGRATTSPGRDA